MIHEATDSAAISTEFLSIIIEYNYFKTYIFTEKTSEISNFKLKIDSIAELFKSSNIFVCLIFRKLFTIEKKTCKKLIICCLLKKIRFSKYMRIIICYTQ